jgi:hypothetical protein
LRAGLLSDPEVISRLNRSFVCTSVIIDDVTKRAKSGDELARHLVTHYEYPFEMMFLTPGCKLVLKMNSFKDFPGLHPDVSAPPGKQHVTNETRTNIGIFLKQMADHFGE